MSADAAISFSHAAILFVLCTSVSAVATLLLCLRVWARLHTRFFESKEWAWISSAWLVFSLPTVFVTLALGPWSLLVNYLWGGSNV